MKLAGELRQGFLNFFSSKDHLVVKTSSLIPQNDPSLLFTNAGMNQFKEYFLNLSPPRHDKLASCQKCLRLSGKHNDLENIGFTRRHHTFFEMLGNFSFGSYFKEEAISLAWEFVTKELKLNPDFISVTYYEEDTETKNFWHKIAKLPENRVVAAGKSDNFWEMGEVGPCGPCTEIHYLVETSSSQTLLLEIWNLVFMEYNKENGQLLPLPKKCVDTGMGLERVCSILQSAQSNFETDLFKPIIEKIEDLAHLKYSSSGFFEAPCQPKTDQEMIDIAFRVLADHSRAITFLIAEGLTPGNDGRAYVLRKLIRRASVFNFKLIKKPILKDICDEVIKIMGDVYPELKEFESQIREVVESEQDKFLSNLEAGLAYLEKNAPKSGVFPGALAFKMHDTFGIPLEVIQDYCLEKGLSLDQEGFQQEMQKQKLQSRQNRESQLFLSIKGTETPTDFVGYLTLECEATLLSAQRQQEHLVLIFEKTPFYAESGGQVSDKGEIIFGSKTLKVKDIVKTNTGTILHFCTPNDFEPKIGETALLRVDQKVRKAVQRAHSATHLLHLALREILGSAIKQAGSKVEADRLRFDYTCPKDPCDSLNLIESLANEFVIANYPTQVEFMPLEEAKNQGAIAFFGDKYGEIVRVVTMGPSKELCGGTHVQASGEIGVIKIVKEQALAAGIRRIEALTGLQALEKISSISNALNTLALHLKTSPENATERVLKIQSQLANALRENHNLKQKLAELYTASKNQPFKLGRFLILNLSDGYEAIAEEIFDNIKAKNIDPIFIYWQQTRELNSFISGNLNGRLLDEFKKKLLDFGGKGGGSSRFFKGTFPSSNLKDFLSLIESL